MRQLYRFICVHKNLLTFLLLASGSLSLIFNQRAHRDWQLFQRSPKCIGIIHEAIADMQMATKWQVAAKELLGENRDLRAQILQQSEAKHHEKDHPTIPHTWDVISARVINNAIMHSKNYITINQGADSGIAPGMGVITHSGIVGRVIAVSKHYACIISLLHTDMQVSAKLAACGVMGTICWKGNNIRKATLLYIPRYLHVAIGDKVVTSGYNSTFHEGIPIGEVTQVTLAHAADFYEITVELSTEFSALQHVYVLNNNGSSERETLENRFKHGN